MADFLLTLVKLSLLGSLLTGLLLLVQPLIKSKTAAYYLWLLVLVRLCLPVGVTLPLPALPDQTAYQVHSQTEISLSGQTGPVQGQTEPNPDAPTPEHSDGLETPARPSINWWGIITSPALWFGLWAAGAAFRLGRYGWGYRRFAALVRGSSSPASREAQAVLQGLDPAGRVALLESPHVSTPMLLGVVRPAIVLPLGMEDDRLADILSHEMTHARRHDLLYKWLTAAITSLHWFNPLMVAVRKQVARSCELACDEAVTRNMDGPARRHYGETLLALAARPPKGMGVLSTTLCEEKEQLKERLVSVMRPKKPGPAALAATLALAVVLTGCAAISGAAPSPTPEPTPDQSALLKDPIVYEVGDGLQVGLPRDLSGQLLLVEPEAGEDFLLSVYEKRSYEAAGAGADMGWLFTLARWDQIQYEAYLTSDGSGVDPFAYKDGWYYVCLYPTDVRFYSDAQDESTLEEQANAWETLNSRLQKEVQPDFIARNGLEPYDNSMYFHDGMLWDSPHRYVYFRTGDWSESITLLLSQPAAQGDGGIWCVEGWMDNNYGTLYLVLPLDTGMTAADYYAGLQAQADQGHQPNLLDPLQAAMDWLEGRGYDVGAGQLELVEGDPAWKVYFLRMSPLLEQPGTLQTLTYVDGAETAVETYDLSSPSTPFGARAWIKAQAPDRLNGKAVTYTTDSGNRLIFLEEDGLVGICRDGTTDWYACAYDNALSPYEVMYETCQGWTVQQSVSGPAAVTGSGQP